MDLLILMTYAAIAIVAFKVFKVPVNAYTVLTTALGGVAILAALLLLMNYNHPYTSVARDYYLTTPIVSGVRGHVTEVLVSDAQHVKAGDVLFKIDPTPFQAAVDQKRAQLASAKQRVEELDENLHMQEQAYEAAASLLAATKDTYERDKELVASGAVSQSAFVQSRQSYLSAEAEARMAQAELKRAELETTSLIDGVHTDVANAQAALVAAQFDLDQTVVRAPTDGIVLQVFLRPGMMAVPLPLKPLMVFQHDDSQLFVASFLQNNAQRIQEGAEAEVVFPAVPGRVFKGKVRLVGAAVALGQLQPSGTLVDPDSVQGDGRINVVIDFDENAFEGFNVPPGSSAEVAVYSEYMEPVAVVRKVLMRMKSWANFVFSDGEHLPNSH
ncbi:HlyD family secretion protein [Aeoliella sp. ICT_H6.2]|uniref:HlyD family secretion protein n=1 Tax=Aeoliella straminimaris TaxID=2954799 RepID=A0A9X2JFM5_9BACT|nr:HlyD family secretion protein [Aeoliella straminimaris]MCO6043871.1 HlyD family secretion protein [Aeoliella straminimaris]